MFKNFLVLFYFFSISGFSGEFNQVASYCDGDWNLSGIGAVKWYYGSDFHYSQDGATLGTSSSCGGALVKIGIKTYAITAAHCLARNEERLNGEVKIRVASPDRLFFKLHNGCQGSEKVIRARSIFIADTYREAVIENGLSYQHGNNEDIALIELASAPDSLRYRYYKYQAASRKNVNATAYGFPGLQDARGFPENADGQTMFSSKGQATFLKHTKIAILDNALPVGMSGGPVFDSQFNIIGVVSTAIMNKDNTYKRKGYIGRFGHFPPL